MGKLAIVGDLHFGVSNNDEKYFSFQKRWVTEELLPTIKNEKCDSVIFLGDIFDNRLAVSTLILNEVRSIFKKLTSELDNVYVIVGNHDTYFKNTNEIHSLDVLVDKGVKVFVSPTEVTMEGKKCLMLPWIHKEDEDKIKLMLAKNKYDMCFGHLEINGFEKNKNFVEDSGLDDGLFTNCKKVYSGHFHIRNVKDKIKYVGTPYELTWNDYLNEKCITVVNLDDLSETICFNKTSPKHLKIKTDEMGLDKITEDVVKNNIIDLVFHEDISDEERCKYSDKISSYAPFSLFTDEEKYNSYIMDESLNSNIKDPINALVEYMEMMGIDSGIDKKILMEKVEEIYEESLKL